MLCTTFSIMRPEQGYVIVDNSPIPESTLGGMKPGAFVVAAYSEGQRKDAVDHLLRLLDEEDEERAADKAAAAEREAAAGEEPGIQVGGRINGQSMGFDHDR